MQARAECPSDMNYIDPETLEFIARQEYDSNFEGYTAMRKFGEPAIDVNDFVLLSHWRNQIEKYPQANVTADDLLDYLMYYNIEYHWDVHSMLMEIDIVP
jgi:hypothetical protein